MGVNANEKTENMFCFLNMASCVFLCVFKVGVRCHPYPGGPLHSCSSQDVERVTWGSEREQTRCSRELWLFLWRVGSCSEADRRGSQRGFQPSSPDRLRLPRRTSAMRLGWSLGPISPMTYGRVVKKNIVETLRWEKWHSINCNGGC